MPVNSSTHRALPLEDIARLPRPGDNVAIATRLLPAGTVIYQDGAQYTLNCTVLVGHRFAIQPITEEEPLLSWGLPFGIAIRPIGPGEYVCNASMIEALHGRSLDFAIPQQPNFRDRIIPYEVDKTNFRPGRQVEPYSEERTFLGYPRNGGRGVGTRNTLVILGTTSATAGFARALAQQMRSTLQEFPTLNGIVPIAHTEGSGYKRLNNREFLLRTLAGLIVHPNVAAILAVDVDNRSTDTISNAELEEYLRANGYPLDAVPHHFFTLCGDWQEDLAAGAEIVCRWLPQISAMKRTPTSLAHLSIALQCGGSDAFSGVSGNPLASGVAKEIIRYGGRANLAETDELIGAEAYVLQNVRDLAITRSFLDFVAQFKERLAWHGQTAEGNPSGGNKYRGLYNIALKSIGAAMKRHPAVCLDWVVDYGERMEDPGFYFMNTPGNDLESIAGQVAGGSNLIVFVTGNGSITNFPFVPTIKVMTTTQRFELLAQEMDVNAGAYLDGRPMAQLTDETLDLLVEIASGRLSKGERAGHSQISIWRNWQQQDHSRLQAILTRPQPNGRPISLETNGAEINRAAVPRPPAPSIGLLLPTSLCSGQIARMAAQHLNRSVAGRVPALSSFAALVHTEGCGVAFASTKDIYAKTMIGYATHPLVQACLFLEHGCEKAHNDYIHSLLQDRGLSAEDFGWASVQIDGGIAQVLNKINAYFIMEREKPHDLGNPRTTRTQALTLALLADGEVPHTVAESLAHITQRIIAASGTVVTPAASNLAQAPAYYEPLGLPQDLQPSLAYGQTVQEPGFHLMETPTPHWTEMLTGLGATGAHLIVAYTDRPHAGHPFVPVLLLQDPSTRTTSDLTLQGEPSRWPGQILELVAQTLAGDYRPQTLAHNHIDFQITRGLLGIST